MDEESKKNGHEVITKLTGNHGHVLHLQDLTADEEEDSNGCKVNDTGGNEHHGLGKTREEVQEGFATFLHGCKGDSKDNYRSKIKGFLMQL